MNIVSALLVSLFRIPPFQLGGTQCGLLYHMKANRRLSSWKEQEISVKTIWMVLKSILVKTNLQVLYYWSLRYKYCFGPFWLISPSWFKQRMRSRMQLLSQIHPTCTCIETQCVTAYTGRCIRDLYINLSTSFLSLKNISLYRMT